MSHSTSSNSASRSHLAWIICVTSSLFFAYTMLQRSLVNTFIHEMMRDLALTPFTFSVLSATFLYVCAACLLPAGLLFDRFSTRKVLLITMSLSVLGVIPMAASHSVWLIDVGRGLTGLGNAFSILGCMRLAKSWFPSAQLALASSIIITIGMLGGLVSQTPFMMLADALGWRHAMWIDVLIGVVIFLIMLKYVRDLPFDQSANAAPVVSHFSFLKSLKWAVCKSENWLGGFYACCLNFPVVLLGSLWGNKYLVESYGLSSSLSANINTLLFVGLIVGAPFFGWLHARLKSYRLPMLLGAIVALIIAIFMFYFAHSILGLAILFFALGFLSGAQTLSYSLVSESNPLYLVSTALALVSIAINLGGALAQTVFGAILHALKFATHAYPIAFGLMPLVFLVSCLIVIWLKEPIQENA